MKYYFTILFLFFFPLQAQTNVVPEGFTGFSASFKNDRNLDFFGEGKFVRDSYGNSLGISYVYDSFFGVDLNYGYSLFNRKEVYSFNVIEGGNNSPDENFNFVDDFRTENLDLGEKTFSIGLTYYLNESQSIFEQNLPINLSLGLRYGTKNYKSDALDFLDQDFYGKFFAIELGAYKEIEANGNFFIIPRIKMNFSNEKNIYNVVIDEIPDTDSFKVSSTLVQIAVPFILRDTSAGQPFIEPSIENKYGTTHIGLRFGLLF